MSFLTTLTLAACGSSLFESNGITNKPSDNTSDQQLKPQINNPQDINKPTQLSELKFGISENVSLVLKKSCSTGGCHNQTDIIDLNSFPFDFKGAYIEDTIKLELNLSSSPNINSIDAQKIVVRELIKATDDGYMPPAWDSAPTPSSQELEQVKLWLAEGLKTSTKIEAAK